MSGGTSYFDSLGLTAAAPPSMERLPARLRRWWTDRTAPIYTLRRSSFTSSHRWKRWKKSAFRPGTTAAEFGQAQGGIYNFTAKSGTNQYHGGLFYRLTQRGPERAPALYGIARSEPAKQFRRHIRRPRVDSPCL